jgi:phosphate-selective porin OprO and OprP
MMRRATLPGLPLVWAAAVLAWAILPAPVAQAQSTIGSEQKDREIAELKKEIKLLEQRVDSMEQLDQKVKVIDRKLEVQAETEQTKAKEAPIINASNQGFWFSSPNGDYRIQFGGIIQADGRFFTTGDDSTGSTFYLNRARPIITGTLWKYYDFNITPDFGQGKVVLQDAYINDTMFQYANFQVGKYKAPFDLERLQVDRYLEYTQRSEIQNLVPNRDIGAELHASLFDNRLTYQLALMNGVPNNTASVDSDNNDGKDFVGRLFATPFVNSENNWLTGIGVGFAATYGDEFNNTISTYKTYGQQTWFTYNKGVTASGFRFRYEPQLYYYHRQFGLMAAFASDRHALNLSGIVTHGKTPVFVNNYSSFTDTGYLAQLSYVLTGEDATYKGVIPRHPFDPFNGTWGALDVVGRISNVAVDSGVFKLGYANPNVSANNATEYAFGINWYLNTNVKWQLDYARTFFNGGAGTNPKFPQDRPDEGLFETQLQISFEAK